MEKANQNITSLLKKNNLKITPGRTAVLSLLMGKCHPLTVEDIQKSITNLNTSTLYRMLDQLVEKKIIYQTDFRNGKAYFEYQENHHHHVVCTQCGETEKIDICVEKESSRAINKTKKFTNIDSHILEFFAVCHACKDKK
jgi:Fe2+ or Zn2+ uptake regulation protein